jgi:hypothetical protein
MEFACSLGKSKNMIRNLILLTLLFVTTSIYASQADTSAYATQRLRINNLLAERSAKFGQYDQSLTARSGIFGLQTKRDIKNSNEILREIVLNDNDIFKELKVLLEYKDLEVAQVKTVYNSNSDRIDQYKLSIKKLQDQNQQLQQESKSLEKDKTKQTVIIVILMAALIGLLIFTIKKLKRKTHETAIF